MTNEYLNKIQHFLRDQEKKNYFRMLYEMMKLGILNKEVPKHYLTRFLYKKNCTNIEDFLTVSENNLLHKVYGQSNMEALDLVGNKLYFHYFMEEHKIKKTELLGYNIGKYFYCNNTVGHMNNDSFFEKIGKENKECFIKPILGSKGQGCRVLDLNDNHKLEGNYIFEKRVVQHKSINTINPSSLN